MKALTTFASSRETLLSKLLCGNDRLNAIDPVENTSPLLGAVKETISAAHAVIVRSGETGTRIEDLLDDGPIIVAVPTRRNDHERMRIVPAGGGRERINIGEATYRSGFANQAEGTLIFKQLEQESAFPRRAVPGLLPESFALKWRARRDPKKGAGRP